jgi:carbon monoxide dehydrogenase subunit G
MAMTIEGEERIEAPIGKVWEALNDPEVLAASIPGCESLKKKSDTELEAVVTLKIGPIKAQVQRRGRIAESEAAALLHHPGRRQGRHRGLRQGRR